MCVCICSFFVALIPRKPKVSQRDKHAIKTQKSLPDIRPARCSKFLYTYVLHVYIHFCVFDFSIFFCFARLFPHWDFFPFFRFFFFGFACRKWITFSCTSMYDEIRWNVIEINYTNKWKKSQPKMSKKKSTALVYKH